MSTLQGVCCPVFCLYVESAVHCKCPTGQYRRSKSGLWNEVVFIFVSCNGVDICTDILHTEYSTHCVVFIPLLNIIFKSHGRAVLKADYHCSHTTADYIHTCIDTGVPWANIGDQSRACETLSCLFCILASESTSVLIYILNTVHTVLFLCQSQVTRKGCTKSRLSLPIYYSRLNWCNDTPAIFDKRYGKPKYGLSASFLRRSRNKIYMLEAQSVRLQTHSPACSGVSSKLRSCGQQSCTLCAQPASPAQYGLSPICRHGWEDNAVASSFGWPHAKHTQTEPPSTRLPWSSFPHAPLGPLRLRVLFSH